jgi:beta-lactamase class A
MGALPTQSPAFPRSRSRFGQDQRTLHPHPHSTILSDAKAIPGDAAPAPRPTREPSAKVTPLRPGRSKPRRDAPQHTISQPASPTREDRASSSASTRPRQPADAIAKPRRRFAKAPLPLLYLIRLIILGVGVAAIAGTLLSVLSPSNVATTSDPEQAAGDVAGPLAYGPLVTGTTATMVSDIALAEDLTRLAAEIEQLASLTPGMTQSVFIVDLDTGDYVDIAGTQAVAAASTIKVPILVAFLQQVDAGNIALNQGLVMTEEQMAGGSGTMQNDPVGTRYTALEVASRMITTSDNTATNMMIDALGGIEALNQRFQAWGLESTVLRNPLPDLDGTNTTSTRDLGLLMALVDQGGLITPRSRDRLMGIMQRTVNRSLIPYGISDDSLLANKTGDIESLLGDVALVDVPNGKRYVIATLVERPENDGRASELIRRTAETAHAELSQPIAPVGGMDPSSPESGVPDPEEPGAVESPAVTPPETESPDRETIPQG